MRRSLVYAGKDLREFACWWDGSKVFRKPSKKVDSYGIPFRNGDLFRSQMAFNNVQIVFNCYIKTDFEKNYTNLVNYLHSFDTYQKLETTAESDVYRMAHIHEEIEPTTGQFIKDGQFSLVFDCMPQEFLKIGDDEITVQNQTPVYSGQSVEFESAGFLTLARAYFSPKQDLNGYEYPWAGGANDNVAHIANGALYSLGISSSVTNEKIKATGTAASTFANITSLQQINIGSSGVYTGYTLMLSKPVEYDVSIKLYETSSDNNPSSFTINAGETWLLISSNKVYTCFRVTLDNLTVGTTVNITDLQIMIAYGSKSEFVPYANICPITGWDSVTLTGQDTYTEQFKSTELLDYDTWRTTGITGGTAVWGDNGVILTASADDCYTNYDSANFPTGARIAVSEGDTLYMKWDVEGTAEGEAYFFGNGDVTDIKSESASTKHMEWTIPSGVTYVTFRVGVRGSGNQLTFKNVSIRKNATYYCGYVDFLSGTLTLTDGYIASYNGETLPSTWISDRDAYAEGTTPTTGAQVVYKLETPQTIQLTANEIALIHGTNTFSTDADSITMRTVDPFRITNPTLMDAKPLIKINNGGSYYIDGELIIQTHGSGATYPMYIDAETMDAYAINEYGGNVSMNGYVDLTAGFILIGKGTHELYSNNANNAWAIVPRWWRL